MAYTESKTNWSETTPFSTEEQNRVESNIKALAEDTITISGNKTQTGNNIHSGSNSFTGSLDINGTIDINNNDINNSGAILNRTASKRIEPAGVFAGGVVTSYVNEATIWSSWAALIPATNDKAIVNGGFKVIGQPVDGHIGYIERTSATRITIHYLDNTSSTYVYYWLESTGVRDWECAISW